MAQGQETQDAYKFPQKGKDLDNLFQKLLAWIAQGLGLSGVGNLTIPKLFLGGGDVELTSKNLGGELYIYNEEGEGGGTLAELYAREYYAGNHRLTSKANSSDVVSAKEAQTFTDAEKAQARANIGAASQSALNSTNQEVAEKTEVIDLQQYVGKRVPTCDYEFMENYMPYYTYGEYPIQWGIVEETDEESNNDFYYVGRYTSNDGITFGYLSFSNKGDWGFRGGNQGFFTEEDVPEALKQAIYAYGLSKDTVYDAQPATLANHPVRTVKEGGTIVFPVSHSGAIFHDTILETTVYDEIEGLKVTRAFNVSNKGVVNKFVKELYVFDNDRQSGDEYYVVWIQRNLNGVYKFQINKRRNGTPSTFLVWEMTNYTESSYIELLHQTAGFKAIVDWEAIENGTTVAPNATLRSFVFDLNFSPTILSKDKLDSITQEQFDTIFNFD